MSLKIIFAGTPDFAKHHLQALLDSHYDICAVYTQPDRPSGRGKKVQASPVKQLAQAHSIPVCQPLHLKAAADQEALAAFNADLMIVVAYGLLLPQAVLDAPRLGCVNVHGSILPAWRGAAPIQRAIQAGDNETGVTIMQMDAGLDTGDMLLKAYCPILEEDTAEDLHDRLYDIGSKALLEVLPKIAAGSITPEQQDNSLSSYAKKIEKAEANVLWSEPATTINRKIRAFNPFPMAFCLLGEHRIRIHKAREAEHIDMGGCGKIRVINGELWVQCGQGSLVIERLQLAGKKPMSSKDFINGPAQHLTLDVLL